MKSLPLQDFPEAAWKVEAKQIVYFGQREKFQFWRVLSGVEESINS